MACRAMLLSALLIGTAVPVRAQEVTPAAAEFFEKQVRPLLVEHCFSCHGDGAKKIKGGLKLTSRADLLQGGDSGPAAVAHKPDESLLIRAVRYQDDLRMPPRAKLQEQEIATLTRWVQLGLPWPETKGAEAPRERGKFNITDEQRRFWSFQPVRQVAPPAVKDTSWPRSDLDRFILAGLERQGLAPAKQADRYTLIRRATFDLTGLPPTPEEVEAFVHDTSATAWEKVVDRLLASPHYGERWGRHWLDVVRYADSFDARLNGREGPDINAAWRYRDWVVDAFNQDMPYDRFLTEQLAGDLLPTPDGQGVNRSGTVATGVLAIGNWGSGDADRQKMLTDLVDDQLDLVGRGFLGLTVTCARCHDHKFDPISTADYYGLAGIFFSTHVIPALGNPTTDAPVLRIPLTSPAESAKQEQYRKRVGELENELKAATAAQSRAFARAMLSQTGRYALAAWDYQHRPADQAALTVPEFAARGKLHAQELRQWIDYLGSGEYRLMTTAVKDLQGKQGLHVWRGQTECPSLSVNTTGQAVTVGTFTLPPRSVAVHPGPAGGVVVRWLSPISGRVKVSGRVVDADPAGGDGVAWALDHRRAEGTRELASGEFANGGAQALAAGKSAEGLAAVEVKAGDQIELLVLPKSNHNCDTTVVELVIASADGSAVWDLTGDLADDPLQGGKGNPHADRQGRAGVWHFLDMANGKRGAAARSPALEAWDRATAGRPDRAALEKAAQELQRAFDLADERSPCWIDNPAEAAALPAEAKGNLARLKAELEALKKNPPAMPYMHGAQEGGVPGSAHAGIHDVKIHVRGSYLRLGELVPRRFPTVLAGDAQPPITQGSGRLELARWLTRPDHPLTARVMVNRLWQHHFGEGIVRTPNNFGKLGQRPTHPELLDWLARQFVDGGWSVKKVHRLILLSATYQQESLAPAETLRLDPDNRLWGRFNRRRLEAEALRDSLLSAAGRLDRSAGGPATRDFNNPRRGLYLMTVRSDRSGFGPLFDTPDSSSTAERRTVSTVAPQALFLLNHPFVLEQTQALAKRLQREARDDRSRLERAFALLYGRPALAEELQIGLEFLARAGPPDRAWEEFCQVLLCANEFVYVD